MMKKYLALLLVLLLTAALLCSCRAAGNTSGGVAADKGSQESLTEDGLGNSASGSTATAPQNQKLVRKVWINGETDDLDTLLSQVDSRIKELSGYVEEREVYNGSAYSGGRSRYANLTVRIPVDQMDAFISQVSENSNITSTDETTENITLSYVATQSRITALETEQTRLLELLAKAENMTDLLQIEKRLTEVRGELEEVTSQLRLYDNMVNYGTIYLRLSEVREYTVVEEPESVWERMGTGFMTNLKNLGNFLVELAIFLVVCLPYLIPLVLIPLGVVLIIRHIRKKKKAVPPPEKEE